MLSQRLALTIVVLLAGCTGSATEDASTTKPGMLTTTTLTEAVTAARAAGQEAVLKLSDFPEGWEEKPHEVTPGDLDFERQLAECFKVDPALFGTDNPTRVHSPDLESPAAATEVQNSVVFLGSREQARQRLATLERPEAPACITQSFSNLIGGGGSVGPGGPTERGAQGPSGPTERGAQGPQPGGEASPGAPPAQVSVQREPFPAFGDGTVAYFVSVPIDAGGEQAVFYGDLVLAIKGQASATFTFLGLGSPFPSALVTQLTQTVIDRLPA